MLPIHSLDFYGKLVGKRYQYSKGEGLPSYLWLISLFLAIGEGAHFGWEFVEHVEYDTLFTNTVILL